MKSIILTALLFGILTLSYGKTASAQRTGRLKAARQTAIDSVETNRKTILEVNRAIWEFAEVGLQEKKSSKLLVSMSGRCSTVPGSLVSWLRVDSRGRRRWDRCTWFRSTTAGPSDFR